MHLHTFAGQARGEVYHQDAQERKPLTKSAANKAVKKCSTHDVTIVEQCGVFQKKRMKEFFIYVTLSISVPFCFLARMCSSMAF